MIQVAERLSLNEGELSRLRWFAHRFESMEEFHSKHPEVKSWTKVKELLSELSPKKGKGKKAKPVAKKKTTARLCQAATSSLSEAIKHLSLLERPEGKAVDSLLQKIQDFVKAAESHLGIRLTFEKR